ncbi:MAG: hypothetical protein DDT40_01404 [candidate division WS2 bacterium]|nr:hypothetical protein [Candidatus Psychracetigena formicireducens]
MQYVPVSYSVGVELFRPYLEESKRRGIHCDYILADIRKVEFKEDSFDAVCCLGVLEHLSAKDGCELIKRAQRWSKRKVIVCTPNGFVEQGEYDANPFQIHKSGWTLLELKSCGFRIHGVSGWRILKRDKGQPRLKPVIFWQVISDITQKVTYFHPQHAFELLCIWEKGHN